jgi:N-acetylglutamate synthase-like GNAT family acetyltransferase
MKHYRLLACFLALGAAFQPAHAMFCNARTVNPFSKIFKTSFRQATVVEYNALIHQEGMQAIIDEMNATDNKQAPFALDLSENSTIWVYLDVDDQVAGFIIYNTLTLPPSENEAAFITVIGIKDSHHNQGIDTALVNQVITDCRQISIKCVRTSTQHQEAVNYFSELGFEVIYVSEQSGLYTLSKML